MSTTAEVRHLKATEINVMIEWARLEGWNPGLYDAVSFYHADPQGFLAVFHHDEPAAVVSIVRYGSRNAFLGLYICRPDLRGQGYGLQVWNAAIEFAGDRVIGLDGVPEQQANYQRSGFALAWQNARFAGRGGGVAPDGLVDLATVPLHEIVNLDTATFGVEREQFLREWITQPAAVGFGVVTNGELLGWGLIRPCATGWKIGPLLATTTDAATRLLDGLLATVPGEEVFLDLPLPNLAAVSAAEERGMTPVFSTARMYRGTPPTVNLDRVWGIASFELG